MLVALLVIGGVGAFAFARTGSRAGLAATKTKKKDLILPRALSNFTATAAGASAFRDFYTPLTPGSPYTVAVATSSTSCAKSNVTITPLSESWKVAHKKDFRDKANTAPNGYILARIDAADCDFERIGLKAGRRAYWVVNIDDNLILTSHFVDVGKSNATSSDPAEATDLLPKTLWAYSECPQSHTFGDDASAVQSRANVCYAHDAQSTKVANRKEFTGASGSKVYLVTDINDPPADQFVWIVCADGCCYADTRS